MLGLSGKTGIQLGWHNACSQVQRQDADVQQQDSQE